ncbi:MAG: hypothetical protein ABEI31_07600 [Halodesulfurarchaeum sp.]
MTDDDEIRVWMVERTFSMDSPHLLQITYATPDGERYLKKEWAYNRFGNLSRAPEVTAAIEVSEERLAPVPEADLVDRFCAEAERMRERHDPDETV